MSDTARGAGRYAAVAILLHWTIAALIILQIALAGRMEARTPEAFAVTQFHKSIGITVLLLSLVRLGWRLLRPPPPEPASLAGWEKALAKAVHWGFYGVMILMPLSGWIMVSASRFAIPTLLYGWIPWPHVPGVADLAPAAKAVWSETSRNAHHLIVKGAYVLLAVHVAGALKHQLFDRDAPVFARMAPGTAPGRWFDPRLLAVAGGAAAVVVFGLVYSPPRPHMTAAPPPAAVEPYAATPEPSAETPATPAAPAPARAETPEPKGAVKWAVSPGSTLAFTTAWSGEAIQGRFERWTADIVFAPDDLEHSKVTVSIDMASANTGDPQRDESLPAADWFDAAGHPKATFTARRFDVVGEHRYAARGTLTLRGVSKPLTLPFKLEIDGDRATVSGVTSLDRTVFGVGQGEWTSTDQIPAKVTVRVNLKARRASP